MSLEKKVVPTLDSRALDTSRFDNVPVFNKAVPGEADAPEVQRCFGGAWYHKVMSSRDTWLGIEGVITLGEFIPDDKRFGLDKYERYMDNPSVYMGGHCDFESDAGLGMNVGYEDQDTSKPLDQNSPKVAWRPFWRYIYSDIKDQDGNVLRRNFNSWNISDPRNFQYYYLPGDTIRMSVYSPAKDYLQLRIEIIEPTTIPKYVEQRKRYGLNAPGTFYSPIFHSEGQGSGKAALFKRVNSIDQFGNEGGVAKVTDAKVTPAEWKEVYLYREIDGTLQKVPFNASRRASMSCPDARAYTVSYEGLEAQKGAERIEIHPGRTK